MVDTLEEIYNDSLTPADFVGGEATILTTNASTRYVIKDIYVNQSEAETAFQVGGELDVNGFVVADLSTNASGTEIVGPSSTVKVLSDFALTYTDTRLQFQTSATVIGIVTLPAVNGVIGKSATLSSTTTPAGSATSTDNTFRQVWTNIGASNRVVVILDDNNSTCGLYVYESNGTLVTQELTNYKRKWFDGVRYVYYINNSQTFVRYDVWNNTTITSPTMTGNTATGVSTYPMIMGVKDDLIIGWAGYNDSVANGKPFYWDLVSNTVGLVSSNANVLTTFGSTFTSSVPNFLTKLSNGTYKIWGILNGNTTLQHFTYTKGAVYSGAQTPQEVTLTNPASSYAGSHASISGRAYYRGSSTTNIHYYDFNTASQGSIASPVTLTAYSGTDLWGTDVTPSAGDIAARTYTVNPSLNLRITGVKSA